MKSIFSKAGKLNPNSEHCFHIPDSQEMEVRREMDGE